MILDNRCIVTLAALFCLFVVVGCVTGQKSAITGVPLENVPSPTMTRGVHFEEGNLVFFAVNVELARFRLEEDLLPLEIAVANKGLTKLTVSPEGITLRAIGEGGQAWPVAQPEESASQNLRSSFDRKLMPVSFEEVVRLRFPIYTYVPSTFGLRGGNKSMSRTAEMARRTWTMAQVWFPNPGGELKGKLFEVWLEAPELDDPVFTTIKF